MTIENSKRLYKHYVETNNIKAAKDMAANRPEVVTNTTQKKDKKK
jgi:hypothetical protein